jgi:Na+-translocating ferredoxin:NAD+ oxidoreductase RnfC subunit
MKEYRRVPTKSLLRRLRIAKYEVPTPFVAAVPAPAEVRIPLQQHIGAPAQPVVTVGTVVAVGDLLADVPAGSLGAAIHASVTGEIIKITDQSVTIAARSVA